MMSKLFMLALAAVLGGTHAAATCTGTATEVAKVDPITKACTGTATLAPKYTPVCDLLDTTAPGSSCPAGCTDVAMKAKTTPTCDLDGATDASALCPASCTSGPEVAATCTANVEAVATCTAMSDGTAAQKLACPDVASPTSGTCTEANKCTFTVAVVAANAAEKTACEAPAAEADCTLAKACTFKALQAATCTGTATEVPEEAATCTGTANEVPAESGTVAACAFVDNHCHQGCTHVVEVTAMAARTPACDLDAATPSDVEATPASCPAGCTHTPAATAAATSGASTVTTGVAALAAALFVAL